MSNGENNKKAHEELDVVLVDFINDDTIIMPEVKKKLNEAIELLKKTFAEKYNRTIGDEVIRTDMNVNIRNRVNKFIYEEIIANILTNPLGAAKYINNIEKLNRKNINEIHRRAKIANATRRN